MAPRLSPAPYPAHVLSIISSTTYPPIPNLEALEALQTALQAHSTSLSIVAETDGNEKDKIEKRVRKEKKRKEREEVEERAALEANERAGQKLEALERARVGRKTGSPAGMKVKTERSASPAHSIASSASFRPAVAPVPAVTYGSSLQSKKKKMKRVLDSDDETGSQARDRSTTLASPPPHLTHTASTSGLKLKLSSNNPKSRPHPYLDSSPTPSNSATAASAVAGSSMDFSLPPNPARPLVPLRPGVQKPFKAGPKRQNEVEEDFSNTKAPSQVAFTTFWSSVEPYLREVREDDLAMLGFKADAPESYDIPSRGRHYSELWDEEDGLAPGTTHRFPVPNMRHPPGPAYGGLTLPHFVPAVEMRDENLVDEQRGLGNLTERIVAAVVGGGDDIPDDEERLLDGNEMEGQREAARVDVVELEDRMKKELRAVMLLGEHEEFDPAGREDDEITSSLRQCQRLLLQQTSLNEARKSRLAEFARHRLAFAEYQNALEGLEKSIEAGWAKRVKKHGMAPKRAGPSGSVDRRPPVPENLRRLVGVRKGWLQSVGRVMRERPIGEVLGLPTSSIYEGIGEESEERDEKTVEDEVEVDSMDVDEVDVGVGITTMGNGK